jgi:hypothetical protein
MDRIVWNGKSSVDNGSLIQSFVVTQKDPPPNGELPLEALAKALIAFRPNAILVEYAYPELYPVLHALEAQWPASVDYKPWYLVVSDLDDEALHAFVGKDAGLRHRILGSQFRSQTLANARFVRHYNETYPEKLTPALASNTSYDAAYLVAYAAAAAGDGPLTGARLAAAMPRLQPPGSKIQTGPSTILEIVAALQRGDNVDLTGSSGSLDFDMTTGDAKVDLVVDCMSIDDSGRASVGVDSGLWLDSEKGELKGKLSCP